MKANDMTTKKAVLFDLDDTLYKYDPAHNNALKKVHELLKIEIGISLSEFLRD